eukprot:jgi/Ulvmu1/2995/UM015_0035.1
MQVIGKLWGKTKLCTAPYRLLGVKAKPTGVDAAMSKLCGDKAAARNKLKAALKEASGDELAAQSNSICSNVMSMPTFQQAKTVVAYLACSKLREVDTEPIVQDMLKRGVRVYVPVVKDRDSNMQMLHIDSLADVAEVPPFGIREPIPQYADGSARAELLQDEHTPEIVLVPGLGFDRSGKRLGRGGGYYDKFLDRLAMKAEANNMQSPLRVGLSFDQQLVDDVPVHGHDHEIDVIVTPEQVMWVDST